MALTALDPPENDKVGPGCSGNRRRTKRDRRDPDQPGGVRTTPGRESRAPAAFPLCSPPPGRGRAPNDRWAPPALINTWRYAIYVDAAVGREVRSISPSQAWRRARQPLVSVAFEATI